MHTMQARVATDLHRQLSPEAREIPQQRFALYEIAAESPDGRPLDAESVRDPKRCHIVTCNSERAGEFSEQEYSRMKYGCGSVAQVLGRRLADSFIKEHLEELGLLDPFDVVVTSSAYKVAPTASNAVMQSFLARLNEFFLFRGKGPAHPVHISRLTLSQGDYGVLTQEQREERMHANRLYVDPSQVQGKHVIIVDDACITGAHERNLTELLAPHSPASLRFLYLAKLAPGENGKFSKIEDRINHADIFSPQNVADLMLRPDFVLNDRVCKFFLSSRMPLENMQPLLENLIEAGGGPQVSLLQHYCLGNGYAAMPQYEERYSVIVRALEAKGLWSSPAWSTRD